VPIHGNTVATRRHLPHLQNPNQTYFVTFTTKNREILTENQRDLVLKTIVNDHGVTYALFCAIVMPDHVHMILTPYEAWTLPRVMQCVKGVSSHVVNKVFGRRGALWQDESFDRVIRADEDLRRKGEYVCANAHRAGIVGEGEDYPWIWRSW
jgi:REP element-mobilizing transposase RayT